MARREDLVVRALVEMADTLVGDFDVVELLTGLAARCVELLGISAAGVMVATVQGDIRLVASSSEAMRVLELFELQADEGPCLDAYCSGESVDHLILQAGSDPWPRFSVAALEAGFQSVSALPLRLRDSTIGALNLFSVGVAPMSEPNTVVARAFADLAAISIIQHRSTAAPQHRSTAAPQHRSAAAPQRRRAPAHQRAADVRAQQPHRHRAGEGHHRRTRGCRPLRGLRPAPGLRAQPQSPAHRRRARRCRRHARPRRVVLARCSPETTRIVALLQFPRITRLSRTVVTPSEGRREVGRPIRHCSIDSSMGRSSVR